MEGLAAVDFSFAAASDLLWELAGVRVETKQVERTAEALGRAVAADERDGVAPAPAAAPTMYLGLDGTGVAVRRSEVEGRCGKQPYGVGKTREVKLVTVWTAETRDKDGLAVRDRGSGQLQRRGRERGQPRHRPPAVRLRATGVSRGAAARLRHRSPTRCPRRRRQLDRVVRLPRASSKPDASRSAPGSSAPPCDGPWLAPTPSSPCAAACSAAASRISGSDEPQTPPEGHLTNLTCTPRSGVHDKKVRLLAYGGIERVLTGRFLGVGGLRPCLRRS